MDDLTRWLESIGLEKYAPAFLEQEIDLNVLGEIGEEDLVALGLPLGPRRKILRALGDLHQPKLGAGTLRQAPDNANQAVQPPVGLPLEGASTEDRLVSERKVVTVLFADIAGSTALISDLDPEDARERLRPAVESMMAAVRRYEGTVNRIQGDGIMALFGAPIAQEDHAARACRAALKMQRDLATRSPGRLRMRVGLHSGEVLVHAIHNDLTVDYEAEGPNVHLAARLESLADSDAVLISARTHTLAGAAIEAKALGLRHIKGISDPVEVYELLDAREYLSRWEITAAGGLTSLVGRVPELEMIAIGARRAASSSGQALLVVGDPGIGKSRLLHEAASRLDAEGWRIIECGATPYERHTMYHSAAELVGSALGLNLRSDPVAISAVIRRRVRALDVELDDIVPALLYILRLPVDERRWLRFDPPQQHRLALEAVRRLLTRLSNDQPVAVLVEDLHWLDPGSQAVLDVLVEGLASAQILVLMSTRPGYDHTWATRTWYTQVPLSPLDRETATEMLRALLANGPDESLLAERLLKRTGGTPLFIEETVRSLLDAGVLSGVRGEYRLMSPVDAIDIPATVQAVIASRTDRLPFEARALLQAAAVVGLQVPVAVLERVISDEQRDPASALAELEAAELLMEVRIVPRELAFRHALIQEVAYQALPRDRRRELHARVGDAIESVAPERLDEYLEVAVEHYRRGERWHRAAPLALRACKKAKEHFAYERAVVLGQTALESAANLDSNIEHSITAYSLLGDVHSLMGDRERANCNYEKAIELCDETSLSAAIRNRYHVEHMATRDGARIAYYVHGAGRETIAFVIPLAYDLAMFQPTIEHLCDEFRLVTCDPRGNGRSDAVPPNFTFSDSVEDLRAVIDDLNERPVHLVGQSRGASIALRLAECYPDLVKSLTLIGIKADRGSYGAWIEDYTDSLEQGDLEHVARILSAQIFSEPETHDVVEQSVRAMCLLPKETLITFFRALPDFDAREVSRGVSTRTLVVHGTDDQNTPCNDGKLIASGMPDATFRPFPGRGHLPNVTARAEFCEVLAAFVRGDPVPGVD